MKFFAIAGVLVALTGLAGCLSVEVSKSEVCGVEHIFASDYGWKLFNWIPVFRSDITAERVQNALLAEAARRNKTVTNLVYHNHDAIMFDLPLVFVTIPLPYVFCYHDIQLSGELQ